jgi:hypothetical protein
MSTFVRFSLAVALMLGLVLPALGQSNVYDVQTQVNLYGWLAQNDPSVQPPGIQNFACVPTAVSNSLVYLQKMYPGTYGTSLIPDTNQSGAIDTAEIGAVASTLASNLYMNTKNSINGGGTWYDMGIYGKHKYLEEVAPGKTTYAAMLSTVWDYQGNDRPAADEYPPIPKPDWVQQNTFPTWQFLYQNLVDGEDVEIGINEGDWGHCLTLTSFHWTDANNDGIIQFAENATIDYVDPATGVWVPANPIYQMSDGHGGWAPYLTVPYGTFNGATLCMAMKESVPEPGTVALLLAAGITGLFVLRRRRHRSCSPTRDS